MSSISKEVIRPLFKVAIVAGEKSGDQLGGELIKSLKLLNECLNWKLN